MMNKEELERKRLKKIIGTKFLTCTIFPLSQFEIAFGWLWGFGKDEKDLTVDEKANLQRWLEVRENILNNGNMQRRNFEKEIDMYKVIWQRYKAVFVPRENYDYEGNK